MGKTVAGKLTGSSAEETPALLEARSAGTSGARGRREGPGENSNRAPGSDEGLQRPRRLRGRRGSDVHGEDHTARSGAERTGDCKASSQGASRAWGDQLCLGFQS